GLEAPALDRAEVDEHVLSAVLRDESESLGVVEPLHFSVGHVALPSFGLSRPVYSRRRARSASCRGKKKRRANWISRGVTCRMYVLSEPESEAQYTTKSKPVCIVFADTIQGGKMSMADD